MDTPFNEIIEALVDYAGTATRAAEWMGVSPQAFSEWRLGGGASAQSERTARLLVLRYRTRALFLGGWLAQQLSERGMRVAKMVVEEADGVALDRSARQTMHDRRWFMEAPPGAREHIVQSLTRAYLPDDLLVDGDVLVFYSPTLTSFVYLDADQVDVSFLRREREPWPALRRFIR